jgi:LysM repeat protein
MGMIRLSRYIVLLFLLISASAMAQPADAVIEVKDGKKCYVHKVARGNTLYGISRTYKVTVDDITKNNPKAAEGIKPGDVLYIPVPGAKPEPVNPETPINTNGNGTGNTGSDSGNQPGVNSKGERVACKTHIVKQGETLFGIARQYGVSVKDIEEVNLFLATQSLQPGMELCIPGQPLTPHGEEAIHTDVPTPRDSMHKHVVMKGETLYSLSKRFMVSQDDIKKANNGLMEGLKMGDTLLIPLHLIPDREIIAVHVPGKDSVGNPLNAGMLKDKYKVVFFIPMFLDANASKLSNTNAAQNKELYGPTLDGVQFYMGAMRALDSLKKAGVNLDVQFFDTAKDTGRVGKILRSEKMKDVDLIIGPFYSSTVQVVTLWAKKMNVPVVVPVPQSNKVLLDNPMVIKAVASNSSKIEGMARFIAETYPGANVIVLDSKKSDDADAYTLFRETYNQMLNSGDYPKMTPLKESGVDHSGAAIKGKMVKGVLNVLVAPSRDITFVSNMMTRLVALRNSYDYYNAEFCLMGLDDWESWKNLDMTYKHRVNLHFAAASFIDYDSSVTNRFIKDFRIRYKTDPNEFGFLGFDVTYGMLAALQAYGTGMIENMDQFRTDGVSLDMELEKVEANSGFENRNVHVLKYHEFDLIEPAHANTSGDRK